MSALVEQVQAAEARVMGIRFLAGPAPLDEAERIQQAHLDALGPYAKAPLPPARIEHHRDVPSVWRRIGLEVPAPSPPRAPGEPGAPSIPGGAPPRITLGDGFRAWHAALNALASDVATKLRTIPGIPERIAALSRARGVTTRFPDPYAALGEAIAPMLHAARWAHPGACEAPSLAVTPQEAAAHALEQHVRWLVVFDGARPSPFEPVLGMWALGAWPIVAPDGALLVLTPPVIDGRVVFDRGDPGAPWPRLGTRGPAATGWEAFDAYAGASWSAGHGGIPGAFTTIHAW